MAFDGLGHYGAVGVAGHADEARHFLLARVEQRLQSAVGRFDFLQIICLAQAVNVQQIDLIHLETLQAALQAAHEVVVGAVRNFRGQPNFLAARGHDLADARLALAIAVSISRVQIGDAQIDGAVERRQGLLFRLVHQEAAAAAKSQYRNFRAGAPKRAAGKRIRGNRARLAQFIQERQAYAGGGSQTNAFQEFSAGEVFFHGLLLRESQKTQERRRHRQSVSGSASRKKNPGRAGRSDAGLTRSWWHITPAAARRKRERTSAKTNFT